MQTLTQDNNVNPDKVYISMNSIKSINLSQNLEIIQYEGELPRRNHHSIRIPSHAVNIEK